MKIILIPVSPKTIEKIIISSDQFPIGRQEMPFSGYPQEVQEILSRRHARIFIQDDKPYIADMGSSNGTLLNGTPVRDKPFALKTGDEISFADLLVFKVEVEAETDRKKTRLIKKPSLHLYLVPAEKSAKIDQIVIMSFPFLVSKADDVFTRYRPQATAEVNFLSRRHAHIFEKDGALYIEDLGSTNGTFVNGQRLTDQAHRISTGDQIAFGGDYFSYDAKVAGEQMQLAAAKTRATPAESQESSSAGAQNKTTFISSATSFLEIFCAQDEALAQDEAADSEPSPRENEQEKAIKGPLARQRRFLRNLGRAFRDDEAEPGNTGKIAAGIVLILLLAGGGWYYLSADKRTLSTVCAGTDHNACMTASLAYLAAHGSDNETVELGYFSALKAYLPLWIRKLDINDIPGAGEELVRLTAFRDKLGQVVPGAASSANHRSADSSPSAPSAGVASENAAAQPAAIREMDKSIALLQRIQDLEGFIAERGGPDGKIVIDRDEQRIAKIVDEWTGHSDDDRRVMVEMIKQVPEFEDLRLRLFSHLRRVKNDKSVYLTAIDAFKQRLKDMQGEEAKRLLTEVARFQDKFPRVAGLQAYQNDIARFIRLRNAQGQGSMAALLDQSANEPFETPFFTQLSTDEWGKNLPPQQVADRFSKAKRAWLDGQTDVALSTLKNVRDPQWISVAQAEIARQSDIVQDYDALRQLAQSAGYENALLAFYSKLDKDTDQYFIQQIAPDFERYRKQVKARADRMLSEALRDWRGYVSKGRIQSLQRLEERISKNFKQQAKRLALAHDRANRAEIMYQMLELDLSAQEQETIKEIKEELAYQRNALEELKRVQGGRLIENKLQLLTKL